ncbi:MAG: hypothetical protein CM15mV65_200 [Caudoviricetes sp.]|nr:MAG: hypothetical protein CM15mV65_200 [Caudoviricetes sp.]
MGASALDANTTGSNNTCLGEGFRANTTASNNTAIGRFALNENTTGIEN